MEKYEKWKGPDGLAKCPKCGTENFDRDKGLCYENFLMFWSVILCHKCYTKSIAPEKKEDRLGIKIKAVSYQMKESPNWVDKNGFLKCPCCGGYKVSDHWEPAGFTGYFVYLKCFECYTNDRPEKPIFVSSGL